MRIIFVRHGDPDYENDSLTPKGWQEAKLLAERISKWKVTDFYCSPLGRAQATASCTLQKMNRSAKTLDWTQEFTYPIDDPVTGRHGIPWDLVPSFWSSDPKMFDQEAWVHSDIMKQNPDIAKNYTGVCEKLDDFLAGYGYQRENHYYKTIGKKEVFLKKSIKPGGNSDSAAACDDDEPVVVIFCHLGAICIMLSHILNIPFPLLVHGFFLPTTSLTVLSAERRWGTDAYFRVQAMGDTSHLLMGKEPVSSAGSFIRAFQG